MSQFSDTKGRAWTVSITVGSIGRVRTATQINLAEALDGKLMAEFAYDPLKFCGVLFWLLKPQLDALKLSEEDLADALAGDALQAAYDAFGKALTDFFQRPDQRTLIGKLLTKSNEIQSLAAKQALSLIESDTMKAKITREMAKAMAEAESILGS